ncbi:recombinase family protein [Streptomyces sp. NPDC014685]|uniref:recombinase family protein n=1 Tax=Streptomyces sp. NPDC014685 TaxID=3364881 RepID=UPI0036FF9DB4
MPIAPEHLHLAYDGPFYAFLYGRASRDPGKKGRSVESQLTEGRSVCEANNWPIIREFPEVDRSASRYAKKTRELWEEMLEGIESGVPRILVAFEASRYYRDLEAYVRLRRACMESGVLLCYDGAVYDLSKRSDRKATAQDAVNAEDEADGIQLRNSRTVRQNAERGGPHGRVLWGYERRYDAKTGELLGQFPRPDRADAIELIFERFVARRTIYSIWKHLQLVRDPVADEREWQYYHVYEILRNPSYAGRRVFQGKDFKKAQWDGIVSVETYEAAQAILNEDGRPGVDWSVQHELAGIGRCGRCPSDEQTPPPPLRSSPSDGVATYVCKAKADVTIRAEKLDAYVQEAVVEWLSSKAAVAAFDPTKGDEKATKARSRHKALADQLEEARTMAADFDDDGKPKLSVASLAAMEARLQPLIDKARQAVADLPSTPPQLKGLVGQPRDVVDAAWADLDIEQRRAIYRMVVNVLLFPARAGGVRKIEPGRVKLTFVGESGFTREWRRVPAQRAGDAQGSETR